MCGIYGQLRYNESPDAAACVRRLRHMDYRGPDHLGTYAVGGLFLGHARLSILDPGAGAHQPFGEGRGNGPAGDRLIHNGEIYNYTSLRKELAAEAEIDTWKTDSDTEVLYELLKRDGVKCLPRLNGMFAFGYWNDAEETLLLARDLAGIKPLYYALDENGIEFASEIKAFERQGKSDGALREVFSQGHLGDDDPPFAGVRELGPGYYLTIEARTRRVTTGRFASLPRLVSPARMESLRSLDRAELLSGLESRLNASLDLHLQSDVPVAALCSGGVDSTLLSALALKRRPEVRLYHCGVEGPGGEEAYARQAAAHLKTDLIVERIKPEDFLELMPEVTRHLDLPIYHPNDMGLYLIARRASRDGVKVLLCGEGADELFGGYSWQRDLARMLRGRARTERLGKTAEAALRRVRTLWDRWLGNPYFSREEIARFAAAGLCYPAPALETHFKGNALTQENFRAWKRWDECLGTYAHLPADEAPVQALLLENLQSHLKTILHRTDRILMAHSIEGRVPFLENDLFEYGLNLPLSAKIHRDQGKVLLKELARRHLPPAIVDRPKAGFPVPWTRYLPRNPALLKSGFVSEWTGLTEAQLQVFHRDDPMMRFRLLALEVWGRIFVAGEKPESIRVA